MKVKIQVRIEVRGRGDREWWRKWKLILYFEGTVSTPSLPSKGDLLEIDTIPGSPKIAEVRVTEVHHDLKSGVLHPMLECRIPGKPLYLKDYYEVGGKQWIEEKIIPRMQLLGFSVSWKNF